MSGMEKTEEKSRAGSIRNAILIAGPTASGKSRLALDLARRENGVIVNTDSMQVYDVLRVLTARPGEDDLRAAPHLLYGHVHPGVAYSTGAWLRDVQALIDSGAFEGKTPIFVGGTGLYFRALVQGLSQIPQIPPAIRDRWRFKLSEEEPSRLHGVLLERDPDAALRLSARDGQRIVRALEVLEATGRSILEWQAGNSPPLIDRSTARLLQVVVAREVLVDRIEKRFDSMVSMGALGEVRALVDLRLNPALPAMRAIGVPELASHLAGNCPLGEAIAKAKASTRQYAKRQATWFRHQLGEGWLSFSPGPTGDFDEFVSR
ncbi:MAG: tRNA (adenosine(37)-N6)-dimethylallyltransferase MiaA [Rhizobiaceae bacterium]